MDQVGASDTSLLSSSSDVCFLSATFLLLLLDRSRFQDPGLASLMSPLYFDRAVPSRIHKTDWLDRVPSNRVDPGPP